MNCHDVIKFNISILSIFKIIIPRVARFRIGFGFVLPDGHGVGIQVWYTRR